MLTKETVIDKIEILENDTVQVRRATYILEDGQRIAGPIYHRTVYAKDADVSSEHAKVRQVAAAMWQKQGGGNAIGR